MLGRGFSSCCQLVYPIVCQALRQGSYVPLFLVLTIAATVSNNTRAQSDAAPQSVSKPVLSTAAPNLPTSALAATPVAATSAASASRGSGASAVAAHGDAATEIRKERELLARSRVLDQQTAEMDYAYQVAQHNCYERFFVNHCLTQAREQMRARKAALRLERLNINEQRRALKAAQRDREEAAARAQRLAEAPQRAANERRSEAAYAEKQRQHARLLRQRAAEAPQREANQRAYEAKPRAYRDRLSQAQREQNSARRAANAQRFEQKPLEARQRARQPHPAASAAVPTSPAAATHE